MIRDEQVPLRKPKDGADATCCRVALGDCVELPPQSGTVVPVRILNHPDDMKWGILEPAQSASSKSLDGLLVGRTLVDVDREELPLRLLNLTDHPRKIKQGTEIAVCQVVQSVMGQWDSTFPHIITAIPLPSHLQDLYERSMAGLMSDQKKQVYDLLCEYSRRALMTWVELTSSNTGLILEMLHLCANSHTDYLWLGERRLLKP